MKQTFLFILCLNSILIGAQTLFAQSLERNLQEFAREMMRDVKNPEQNLGLQTEIQDILRPHSDFLFNTLPNMQTDPEFEPYIEKYEALKGQYMGNGQSISIDPNIKIVLTASPFVMAPSYDKNLERTGFCLYASDLIIIDRGFWEYYQDNDEAREALLFHELGHCDLKQEHGHNAMMNMAWMDDVLTGKAIGWHPLYKEFFRRIYRRNETIVCSEASMHFYERCDSYNKEGMMCDRQGDCYIWRV